MGRKLAPVTDDGPLMDGRQAHHSVPQDGAGPEFFAALREARILVNAEQQRRLLASSDPLSAIARARDLGIGPGMLGNEDLEQMLDAGFIEAGGADCDEAPSAEQPAGEDLDDVGGERADIAEFDGLDLGAEDVFGFGGGLGSD